MTTNHPDAHNERINLIASKISAGVYRVPLERASTSQRETALSVAANIAAAIGTATVWYGFDTSADNAPDTAVWAGFDPVGGTMILGKRA